MRRGGRRVRRSCRRRAGPAPARHCLADAPRGAKGQLPQSLACVQLPPCVVKSGRVACLTRTGRHPELHKLRGIRGLRLEQDSTVGERHPRLRAPGPLMRDRRDVPRLIQGSGLYHQDPWVLCRFAPQPSAAPRAHAARLRASVWQLRGVGDRLTLKDFQGRSANDHGECEGAAGSALTVRTVTGIHRERLGGHPIPDGTAQTLTGVGGRHSGMCPVQAWG
jgi:hypothetical protein